MNEENSKHSTVGKTHEIDQRAIKVFLSRLPDIWLPRKQDPDFFVDYLVEIVENGEPIGLHFAAQIKGYEDITNGPKPLSYRFKTKHLKYYLNRSQHPVFLFLINVTTREGYWLFAQKHLKGKVSAKDLDDQGSLTIHFLAEDSLSNFTKFKCLLPEAEQFVRDLHPGSVQAALQKRKAELESKDPRCSVSISINDGKEHISITPKETFSFTTKLRSQNVKGWNDFFERGAKLKLKRGEIEIVGAPALQEAFAACGDDVEIQYGKETPGSLHVISKVEGGKIIPIEGHFRSGTKFMSFHGRLPDSPLEISFETTFQAAQSGEPFDLSIGFSPSKWVGQPILFLAYLDQITSFAKAFSGTSNPEMEIFINGNSAVKGEMAGKNSKVMQQTANAVEWFNKCRWLAQHYRVNPILPPLDKLGRERMDTLEELYDLLTKREIVVPSPSIKFSFFAKKVVPDNAITNSDRLLRIEKPEQIIDFFGTPVLLGPTRHFFTDMNFVSQSSAKDGAVKVILAGTEKTTRTSTLV